MSRYNIYTDGSLMAQGDKSMGGWSFVVVDNRNDSIVYECYGKLKTTVESCIRPELEAVYQALCWSRENIQKSSIHIITDNEVIVGSINGECRRNTNRQYWDLIEPIVLNDFFGRMKISHVRAHISEERRDRHNRYNALCDRLAKKGANSLLIKAIEERQ